MFCGFAHSEINTYSRQECWGFSGEVHNLKAAYNNWKRSCLKNLLLLLAVIQLYCNFFLGLLINDADIELYVYFFFSLDVSQNKMNVTFCCHSYKCFQNHEMSSKKYKTKKFYSSEILRSISTTVSEDRLIYLLLKLHNLTQTKNCCPNHLRKCWPLLH